MNGRPEHQMPDMDMRQRMTAYAEVSEHFDLRSAQRDALDATMLYPDIMRAAHVKNWNLVEALLIDAAILSGR